MRSIKGVFVNNLSSVIASLDVADFFVKSISLKLPSVSFSVNPRYSVALPPVSFNVFPAFNLSVNLILSFPSFSTLITSESFFPPSTSTSLKARFKESIALSTVSYLYSFPSLSFPVGSVTVYSLPLYSNVKVFPSRFADLCSSVKSIFPVCRVESDTLSEDVSCAFFASCLIR